MEYCNAKNAAICAHILCDRKETEQQIKLGLWYHVSKVNIEEN